MRIDQTREPNGAPNLTRFPWYRWQTGYSVVEGATRGFRDLLLVPAEGGRAAAIERFYPLEEHPALFRDFATLATPDDVLGFAHRWGWLGLATESAGESVTEWLHESADLRLALRAWDLLDSRDKTQLRDFARQVNDKLRDGVSPQVLISSTGEFRLYLTPSTLLSALWVQFAQQVTGTVRIAECAICGKPMDVTENRSHKRVHDTCSLRDRMRRYRAKKKE